LNELCTMTSSPRIARKDDEDMICLLEKELKASDDRYLHVRSQLLEAFTSNAQLLEYTQYVEDQLAFYKHKASVNDKKSEIRAKQHELPPIVPLSDLSDPEDCINQSPSNTLTLPSSKQEQHPKEDPKLDPRRDPFPVMSHQIVESLSNGQLTMDDLLSTICSVLDFDAASIYSISHTLDLISCECSTLKHLSKTYSSPLNHGILSQIVKQKRAIQIANVSDTHFQFDPQIDDRFLFKHDRDHNGDGDPNENSVNDTVRDSAPRRTKTVCLEPLFNGHKEMVGILEMSRCGDRHGEYGQEEFKSLLRFSRNVAAILIRSVLVQRELEDSKSHKEALLELAKMMSNSNGGCKNNIENFIERVRKTVYKSIRCDKVAVFMVDEMTKELWCQASDDVSGLRLPIGAGIVGHAVTTGQTLNIHDAYTDSRFNSEVDVLSNYRTKTILCVPIQYSKRIIGALECINKSNGECFSEADVSLLNQIAEETASSLQNKFMESALRIISQGLQDSSSRDYLSQFMHSDDHILLRRKSKQDQLQMFSLSRDAVAPKLYSQICSGIRSDEICTWHFDYFSLIEDGYQTAIGMMVFMFTDLRLLDRFHIPERKLTAFLVAVKQHYYDNPYHNFLHAFSVMHICYLLLKKTSIRQHFEDLDILVMLVAAVCHDLEHPGLTNAYQVNSGSDLALRYNDKSVLENHHAHIASMLLRNPEMAILSGLSQEQMAKARRAMISIILHTDMSYHQDIVSELLRFGDRSSDLSSISPSSEGNDTSDASGERINATDRLFLSQAVVHLGDISNPVMSWTQSKQWSQRVITEFVAQSKLEREQGLQESMAFINDGGIAKVQLSFIDYVAKPLWKNAQIIAPELRGRLDALEENRKHWEELLENESSEKNENESPQQATNQKESESLSPH